MSERPLDSVDSMSISDAFLGNTNTFLLDVLVKAGDAAADILTSPELPGGLVYTGIEVRTSGNTAGLTLDVGWRGNGEHRAVVGDADIFGAAVVVATTGTQQLLDVSYPMNVANSRQVAHVLTFTLGGTVTVDERVEVLVTCIDAGRL